jgi:hypothetical protein
MKPEILIVEAMMPETEAQLEAAYRVHRLYNAADRAALLQEVGPTVRGIATGGHLGASEDIIDALCPSSRLLRSTGLAPMRSTWNALEPEASASRRRRTCSPRTSRTWL